MRLALLGLTAWACATAAADPQVKWIYEAQSQLYASPLVVDVHPSPGFETVISDSDARVLRCIGADGQQLWQYDGEWKKRLTSRAALNRTQQEKELKLAVGNGDGSVDCIDAATGARLWKVSVGSVEWSNVVWANLQGDPRLELIVGSEATGLTALDASGNVIWKYAGKEGAPLSVRGHIAAADVDEDGRAEIFACGKWSPVCVNADGTLRWQAATGDDFYESSVVVSDTHAEGWRVYATSQDPSALQCFDAATGERRWFGSMIDPSDIYSASSVAVGFLDNDYVAEVVLADRRGRVYCFGVNGGDLHWVYPTEKKTHAAVSIGDADCDGRFEVLAASGDHHLYCLAFDGTLEWRYATDLRIIGPARTADVDRDGILDLMIAGSDHKLRCLTLRGQTANAARPLNWPNPETETRPLLLEGGFEKAMATGKAEDYPQDPPVREWIADRPLGWRLTQGPPEAEAANEAWGRDTSDKKGGEACLRVGPSPMPGEQTLRVSTDAVELEPGLRWINASVWWKGTGKGAGLEWLGTRGEWGLTPLTITQGTPDGWEEHRNEHATPPHWARWVRLRLESPSTATVRWDEARVEGVFVQPRKTVVLTNQAGYDAGMPKQFVVQTNFVPGKDELVTSGGDITLAQVRCIVQTLDGRWAGNGRLKYAGRITGAFGNDWGSHYWRGDFSDVNEPGQYRLEIWLGTDRTYSRTVEIGKDLIWQKTARPAYRFFYYQRCGMEIPGYHGACHLDDSTDPSHAQQWDLAGGWHDAGDYNKYHNAPYVLGLAWAYERQQELFAAQDEDGNGKGDFLDEVLWGADHARKMIAPDGSAYGPITSGYGFWGPPEIETDNRPLTGDERPTPGPGSDPAVHAAALAKAAKLSGDAKLAEAASRALQYGLDKGQRGPLQFVTAIDLYLATKDEKYEAIAKEMEPGIDGKEADALELFDRSFGADHRDKIRAALTAEAETLLANAQNPFGVWTFGPPEKPNFFGTPAQGDGWHVGNSARMFEAATRVALAYRYHPDPRYLEYVYDQFNWALGCNPYDISLMEGVGAAFPPSYHQRLTFAGVERGAIPGSLVNGITYQAPGDDRPYFDMSGVDIPAFEANEVWLPHNTAYLNALASLQQAHAVKP